MIELQRLFQDKARLRHRSLRRVDEQNDAVDHFQNALHLAAEIGMSGRIDDIDLDAVIMHGGIFGENRDAALSFDGIGVHDTLLRRLIFPIYAALLQHFIHKRRFAVVDMCDDGDVSQIFSFQPFVLAYIKIHILNLYSIAPFFQKWNIFLIFFWIFSSFA